ncbi:hypothetical protein PP175_14710 [Aneurinibacillus sp. Ricciae_BoGa-3]|uniref:CDP-alcohol phosphatidyltransferase family protein n=1 Tax=Aneurinibacillus sp. Ricciae_BoGa-3 TaxID=3022697 RepID=UPI002340F468|nr:CDP-alcohol phosphatidyltransferase family protein [Aneurinibacillus sp. Ricciae_BoGa-3]WCK52681.1 hypothetical protein PP175_14710 [Aneurinibacillus sp. Ricciae_BoGa-3]
MKLAKRLTLLQIIFLSLFILCMTPVIRWIGNLYFHFQYMVDYSETLLFVLAITVNACYKYLANKKERTSFHSFFNLIADKILISAALILLVQEQTLSTWIAMMIVGREIIVAAYQGIAVAEKVKLSPGRLEKATYVAQVIGILIVMSDSYSKLLSPYGLDNVIMLIAALLTVYTGLQYFTKNTKATELLLK